MTNLSGINIIIVDFGDAYQLRASLMSAGATVHVVSRGGALVLARHKRIDAAFVDFDAWRDPHLCEQLSALGVRQIIVTADEVGSELPKMERERGTRSNEPLHAEPGNADWEKDRALLTAQ